MPKYTRHYLGDVPNVCVPNEFTDAYPAYITGWGGPDGYSGYWSKVPLGTRIGQPQPGTTSSYYNILNVGSATDKTVEVKEYFGVSPYTSGLVYTNFTPEQKDKTIRLSCSKDEYRLTIGNNNTYDTSDRLRVGNTGQGRVSTFFGLHLTSRIDDPGNLFVTAKYNKDVYNQFGEDEWISLCDLLWSAGGRIYLKVGPDAYSYLNTNRGAPPGPGYFGWGAAGNYDESANSGGRCSMFKVGD